MSYVYSGAIDLEQLLANGRHAGIDVYLLIQVCATLACADRVPLRVA